MKTTRRRRGARPRLEVEGRESESRLLAGGRRDVTSTSGENEFLRNVTFGMAGRQAGRQHLLVTGTGAKTTEFP